MAWHRPGDKPLFEFTDAYMRQNLNELINKIPNTKQEQKLQ